MDPTPLHEIAAMCGGTLLSGDGSILVSHFSKDTRSLTPGDCYIALRGEHFNGNQFVAQAEAQGAVAALVDAPEAVPLQPHIALILVPSCGQALHDLARAWRQRLSLRAVCITGSNGKTSTKEFTAAVLSSRFAVSKTYGNFNNHFGVPLSILEADSHHAAAVWEIGMNHRGEIAPLAALAQPDIAIITQIGVAHMEYMHSQEAIAEEKGDLLQALQATGTMILSADDPFTPTLRRRSPARLTLVSLHSGELTASAISVQAEGTRFVAHSCGEQAEVLLPVHGRHMVLNALFALAAGQEFGISLEEGARALGQAHLVGNRLRRITVRGIHFLDDSYNANPDSMSAALRSLAEIPCAGRRFAILGRMGELGSYAETGYQQVAQTAVKSVDILVTVGAETHPLFEGARSAGLQQVHLIQETTEVAEFLRKTVESGDLVLIKGSHSAQLGRVIEEF